MTNSLLLRIAVGLCVANTLFGLWSTVTVSNARSRLSRAEMTIEETSTAADETNRRLEADLQARAASDAALAARLAGIDKQMDELKKAAGESGKAEASKK